MPNYPIGTAEGLREVGLSPGKHPCCGPMKAGKQHGCGAWKVCREVHPRKPVFLGIEILLPTPEGGVSVRREIVHCHAAYPAIKQAPYNGIRDELDPESLVPNVVRIVAREGEEIELTGTEEVKDEFGRPQIRQWARKVTVPKHPIPRELPQYSSRTGLNKVARDLEAERAAMQLDSMIGHLNRTGKNPEDDDEPGEADEALGS